MSTTSTIVGVLLVLASTSARAEPPQQPDTPTAYLAALATANSFLSAWSRRDPQSGLAAMCEKVASPSGAEMSRAAETDLLSQYVRGLSNPHHHAFEVGRGRETADGRFTFPVVLYELYTGAPNGFSTASDLTVALVGNRWCVASLPRTTEAVD